MTAAVQPTDMMEIWTTVATVAFAPEMLQNIAIVTVGWLNVWEQSWLLTKPTFVILTADV